MFAARAGRLSSSGPSPNRGCTSSKYATHGRQKRRPNTSPTTSCSPSSPASQPHPSTAAPNASMPIVAWLKRGARESITAVSRYGSARRCIRAVCLDQHLRNLGPGELDRRQLACGQHLANLRTAEEDVILRLVRARLRARHGAALAAPEGVLEEHRLDIQLVGFEVLEDQLRVVGSVVVADAGVIAPD